MKTSVNVAAPKGVAYGFLVNDEKDKKDAMRFGRRQIDIAVCQSKQ
jgi:hypothetical protein